MRLAVSVSASEDGSLPTEFRLFVAGWNDTAHGRFLFDDAAAKSVMAAYAEWGVDLAIDLEHQMLDRASADPTARDARGWCKLALRDDGSLWAVDVSWTPDGAQRLSEKRQRYVSPAFEVDPETSRVVKILNVAIVAMPATHNTPALVAASAHGASSMLTPELSKKALEVIAAGDAAAALAMLQELIASAAGGEAPEAPAEEMPAEGEALSAPEGEDDDEEMASVVAASSRLMRLTAKTTIAAAVDEVELWRASHIKLETETKKLAAEREALELGQRKANAAKLVALGAETPHTSGLAKGKLARRLLDEPLDEQNARVEALLAARGGKLPSAPKAPTTDDSLGLTERELQKCKAKGVDPAKYAAIKNNGKG